MNNKFGKDLTEGSVPRNLIKFALPILVANILMTGYSIINAIWVGRLLGGVAIGAVAASFPVSLTMVALSMGSTLATSILVSRNYGAKNYEAIQKIANVSITIAAIMIVIVTVTGLFLSDWLLKILDTPSALVGPASGYLKIMISGFGLMYLTFLIMSTLRGIGNSVTPLIFVAISTIINAILDPLLIAGIGPFPEMRLNGAAIASLVASFCVLTSSMIYIGIKYKKMPIIPSKFGFDVRLIFEIIKIGLPSFLQQMLLPIGYGFITYFVNKFGADATAAFGIASRVDSVAAMPAMAVMMSVSTLTAQSFGAKKLEKISDILKWGLFINVPVTLILSSICIFFPKNLVSLFVNDSSILKIGIEYFQIVGFTYLLFIPFYVTNGIINGFGKTIVTMFISFGMLCLLRIPLVILLVNMGLGLKGIWFSGMIATAAGVLSSFILYRFVFKQILKKMQLSNLSVDMVTD